jgi:serine/threonine protein kinase
MNLQIPGYTIVKPIAEGGMASVYLAVQQSLERHVALKLLKNINNPAQLERFHNEGKTIASLNHRNIINIHDTGIFSEQYYISMEYLAGGDLEDRIAAGISPHAALDLLQVIGNCLEFIHRKNIIHRDIKPANILFHTDGTPILTDFGIAKHQQIDSRLTLEDTALGSPYYLSPEQAESRPVDGRADIYGLGIILHEMLTGIKPYQGDSHIEVIVAHLTEPLPALPPELSIFQELLDLMIAKSPEDRFNSAGEMVDHIRRLRQDRLITERKKSGLARVMRRGKGLCFPKDIMTRVTGRQNKTELLQEITNRSVNTVRATLRSAGRFLSKKTLFRDTRAVAVVVFLSAALGLVMIKPFTDAELDSGARAPTTPATQELNGKFVFTEKTEPEDTYNSKHDLEFQAGEYIHKAQQSLDEYRLTTPDSDNAYYYYQLILEQDPEHEEALEGIALIADMYADLAEKEIDKFRYAKARVYIDRGLAVDPSNQRLFELDRTKALADASKRFADKVKSLFQ